MTNILAQLIITLVTNVVQTDNAQWGRDWTRWYPEGGGPATITIPATERYATTNVIERATLTWELWGEKRTQVVERTVSSVTATERLDQAWRKVGVRTNDITPIAWTNVLFVPATNWIFTPNGGAAPLDWTRKDNAK